MNPQSEARAELARRLRAHAQIEDKDHATDLNQAANEVEELGTIAERDAAAFVWRLKQCLARAARQFFESETEGWEPLVEFVPSLADQQGFPSVLDLEMHVSTGTDGRGPLALKLEVTAYRG